MPRLVTSSIESNSRCCALFDKCCSDGGFIQPPMGPDDYFVSADDIEVHDDEVTWVLENDDIAQDGINGVVSFLAAYHQHVAALREVLIE